MVLVAASVQTGSDPAVLSAVTGADQVDVQITIYAPADDSAVPPVAAYEDPIVGGDLAPQSMSWDVGLDRWVFTWDTATLNAGNYGCRVRVIGPGMRDSWEYTKLKLSVDKQVS